MKKEDKKLAEQRAREVEAEILAYQKRTGHKRPVTRREFLNAGLLQFSGLMVAPTIWDLIARNRIAHAADCPDDTQQVQRLVPFVTVNLAGGWSLAANWLPRDRGGQMITYRTLGNGRTPATVNAFANNAVFSARSDTVGFLNGVKSIASVDTLSKTAFIGMPVDSDDDSGNNPFSAAGIVSRAGLAGQSLPFMGTANRPEGVNHQPAYGIASPPPLRVQSINDVLGAVGFTGSLSQLSTPQQTSLAKTVQNLSNTQARKLASYSGGQNFMDLVECATGKNVENVAKGTGGVDVRTSAQSAQLGAIWNFGNGGELARASMVYNALTGQAGAIGLEMGGYDYHQNARASTDGDDRTAGVQIGRILQSAAIMNQPVFIYLISDGSVSWNATDTDTTDSASDSGGRGAVAMIAFNPAGAPQARASQLGAFTTGEVADTTFITGGSPQAASAAAFANWLTLSGKRAMFQQFLPNVFNTAQLDQVILF